MKALVVAIHDVCPPYLSELKEISEALHRIGITKKCLKVIPNYQGKWNILDSPDLIEWLHQQQDKGDEIIHHGYEHQNRKSLPSISKQGKNNIRTSQEAEFARMNYTEAKKAIVEGRKIFQAAGIDCKGFTAPTWRQSRETTRAIMDCGFQYFTRLLWVNDYTARRKIFSPAFGFQGISPSLEYMAMIGNAIMKKTMIPLQNLTRIILHPQNIEQNKAFSYTMTMLKDLAVISEQFTYEQVLNNRRR